MQDQISVIHDKIITNKLRHTIHIITGQDIVFAAGRVVALVLLIAVEGMFPFKPGAWSTRNLAALEERKRNMVLFKRGAMMV